MESEQEDTKQHRHQSEKPNLAIRKLRYLQESLPPVARRQQGKQALEHKKQAERDHEGVAHRLPYFFAPPGVLKYLRNSEFGSISNTSLRVLKLSL